MDRSISFDWLLLLEDQLRPVSQATCHRSRMMVSFYVQDHPKDKIP